MTPGIQQAFEAWWASEDAAYLMDKPDAACAFEAGYSAARNGPSTPHSVAFKAICPPAGEKAPITAEDVYNAYPRKVGRSAAIKAIQKAGKGVGMERLLKAVKAYAEATSRWPAEERQYIPHPATWFNRGSYDDDPKEWERGSVQASQFSQAH